MERTVITAIFGNPVDAARAVDELLEVGVERRYITLLMGEEVHRQQQPPVDAAADPVAQETARGAKIGALFGGSLAALATAAVSLSGIGLVVVGPLAAALGAGTAGAAVGGLLGALIGLGVRSDVARVYDRVLREGAVLVGATVVPEQLEGVEQVFQRCGGRDPARMDRAGSE
jgi:hypothetical protein